jgi:ribosomal protein L11 methylase PrmA
MFTSIFKKFVRSRSEEVARRVSPYINKTDKIIDIGSGSGDVSLVLQSQGMNTTPVDVGDFH